MNPYLMLVVGFAAGAVIVWLISQARTGHALGQLSAHKTEVQQLNDRIGQMNARIDELNALKMQETERRAAAEEKALRVPDLEKSNESLRSEAAGLRTELATLSTTLTKERESVEKQLKVVEDARANLADAFKALSAEALNTNNKAFLQLAKETLETFHQKAKGDLGEREKAVENLVKPLKESLERYEKQIKDLENARQGAYSGLEQQVKSLFESEQLLKKETGKLVNALSAPQVRGQWGEITLRRVAELAGMVEHCDFVEQESTDSESGRFRPDMIVSLPNNRKIVIDAKAPLKAYMEAVETTSEADRHLKCVDHARLMRVRVQDLCKKEYWDQFKEAPEFVVMFLPGEQFLGAALQEDPGLLEDAFSKKVVIATPTTLMALLKAVAYGWRQEILTENAQKISELGQQLYERLATLASYFEDLGKSLDRSVQSYNRAVGSLETRVIVTARKFKELGATGKDEIPELTPIEHTSRQMLPIGFDVDQPNQAPPA